MISAKIAYISAWKMVRIFAARSFMDSIKTYLVILVKAIGADSVGADFVRLDFPAISILLFFPLPLFISLLSPVQFATIAKGFLVLAFLAGLVSLLLPDVSLTPAATLTRIIRFNHSAVKVVWCQHFCF